MTFKNVQFIVTRVLPIDHTKLLTPDATKVATVAHHVMEYLAPTQPQAKCHIPASMDEMPAVKPLPY
eukprot:c37264_g1_i1 orf=81-281(+)